MEVGHIVYNNGKKMGLGKFFPVQAHKTEQGSRQSYIIKNFCIDLHPKSSMYLTSELVRANLLGGTNLSQEGICNRQTQKPLDRTFL